MSTLVKALLIQLKEDFKTEASPSNKVTVQFNPESLKVSYANQLVQGDQKGTSSMLTVGRGTTKLSVQLWFDVTVPVNGTDGKQVSDVRDLTKAVQSFIEPKEDAASANSKDPKLTSKVVRFEWGSFRFDGIMESIEESLEYFSPEGRPLRANMSLSITQQKIEFKRGETAGPTPGKRPLTTAPQDASVQSLAADSGRPDDWPQIAEANGIENPRQLAAGQLLDMNLDVDLGISGGIDAGIGVGVSANASLGVSGGAGVGIDAGIDLGVGVSAGVDFRIG